MGRNLKYQFNFCITQNFKEGMDKHSIKAQGIKNDGKIFSYADRKNLIDVASNFSNYMKENHKEIKLIKDIKSNHVQEFLNSKAKTCSYTTLEQYISKFNKLKIVAENTYKCDLNFNKKLVMPEKEKEKKRNTAMNRNDFNKLENYYKDSSSTGKTAIQLSSKLGLRVSECTKLQGRDIDLEKNIVRIIDSKGKRNRDVPIRNEDREYFSELKVKLADRERACPVRPDSIHSSLNKAMNALDIKKEYSCTSVHAIRKMYAQEEYDKRIQQGMERKEALDEVSELLGHGKDRMELMKEYVLKQ